MLLEPPVERPLNWFGWSIETIAAVYESNAAATEIEDNPTYWESAWRAEQIEVEKDKLSVHFS